MDLLTAWGVTTAAGLIFKPILQDLGKELKELTKDATEDWVKDLFKDKFSQGSSRLLNRFNREPLDIAAGKAIKGFLEIVQDCLDDADLETEAIATYRESVKLLLKDKSVRRALGEPFQEDCTALDTRTLQETWEELNELTLPNDFDWDRLGNKYLKKVKAIYRESEELQSVLDFQQEDENSRNLEEIAGITTEFSLAKYQETILEQYGNLKLESIDSGAYIYDKQLKIYQIFIPQKVKECQEYLPQVYELPKDLQLKLKLQQQGNRDIEINPEELERYQRAYSSQQIKSVLEVIDDDRYKYLVILGDPGSGKSTLLQYLAVEWARLRLRELPSHPITLLIELQKYNQDFTAKRCKDFLEFIDRGSNWVCHLNQHELDRRLKKGAAKILFDGLDEVFDSQQRDTIIKQIHSFTKKYSQVKVILTSRIIGYEPQKLKDANFRHFMLQDLELPQIENFLKKWHDLTYNEATESQRKQDRQQRITKAIKESPAIQQLAANPLLLTMMTILNRHQDLPRERAELYKETSKLLLHQWDLGAGLPEHPELRSVAINYRDKQAMLREVAHFMQGTEKKLAGNLISYKDLEAVLVKYLENHDFNPAQNLARLMIDQLRTRNFILCGMGSNFYAFVHRTFLEYFCAWSYIWQFKETQTLSIEQIKTDVYGEHWQDESWHEVLRLIAGMLDPKFVGEIIEYLMDQDGDSANFANLFLAADCLAEVSNRRSISQTSDRLLNQLQQLAEFNREVQLNKTLSQKVINAIVNNWKNAPNTLTWLTTCLEFDCRSYVPESAVSAIAKGWHDDPNTLPIIQKRAQSYENRYVRRIAVQELAQGWHDDPNTLPIIQKRAQSDRNSVVRSTAVQELAQGWHDDPDTLPIIQKRAQSDNNQYVRRTAVQELAQGWHDDSTLSIIKERTQLDHNWEVRSTALQELAQGWHDDSNTLSIIQKRAQSDNNQYVRRTAIQELAQKWHNDPDILQWLKERVQSDDNWAVRRTAIQELAQKWHDDPDILQWLKERVQSDDNWEVRSTALQELAQGWHDESDTLRIVKERVQADDDEYVRSTALQELAQGWHNDSETFTFLFNRAVNDPFVGEDEWENNPRKTALEGIMEYFPRHPQTKDLLLDRAQNDPDEQVREFAKQALEKLSNQE